ncbi:hypothetical protein [Paenibacillus montanisoli]|uniref:Uncharacterized protein n=1 Tax=Paenibacillus montanisoli TaxID=2081970 RepID=A0A328TUZ5_9BACL|nr:hypothetical protein [Paenibacillus montanisoli]RAP74359.1 hypothetical protein DL346_19950 [Paenibacillus montanisoli]
MPVKVIQSKAHAESCLKELHTYLKVIYTELINQMDNNNNTEYRLMEVLKFGKFSNIPYSTKDEDISIYEIVNHVFGYIITFKACLELYQMFAPFSRDIYFTCNLAQSKGLDLYSTPFTDASGKLKQIACEIFAATNERNNSKLKNEIQSLEHGNKLNGENGININPNDVEKFLFFYLPQATTVSQNFKILKYYPNTKVNVKWIDIKE